MSGSGAGLCSVVIEASVILVLKTTGSTPIVASSDLHELLAELLADLGHGAGQVLRLGDPGPPAKGGQAAHIQLLPGGVIGFAGVPENFASVSRGLGNRFRQRADGEIHARAHIQTRWIRHAGVPALQRKHAGHAQNIRLFDGDVVSVGKSDVVLREQLLKAGQTNLSPQFIQVYVSGRVVTPGGVTLPQGSALNQAINLAGGTRLLKGKVEFIRLTREGEVDQRI